MEKSCHRLLVALGLLILVTAAAIGFDMLAWQGRRVEHTLVFQKATGGLGLGAIATPIWQFINYDARILSVDDSITWPVPGGYSYGPDRTATVSYFEEVPKDQWIDRQP